MRSNLHIPGLPARLLLALLFLLGAPALALAQRAPTIVATSDRIDAVPGLPVLIPVRLNARTALPRYTLRLDDGREIDAELVAFDVRAPVVDAAAPQPWLTEPLLWAAWAPGPSVPESVSWRLLAEPPPDAVGQGLWLEGRRIALTWLPDPWALRPDDVGDPSAPWACPNPPDLRTHPVFLEYAELDRLSPVRRWRWKLATEGLAPRVPGERRAAERPIESPEDLAEAGARAPVAERALEAYAALTEARWRVALANLWRADRRVAANVRARLAGVGEMTPGPVIPIYAPLDVSAEQLLDDLTDPTRSPERRAQLARAWLDDQPEAIFWVIDDAGRAGLLHGQVRPTLGVVNLAEEPHAIMMGVDTAPSDAGIDDAPVRRAVALRPDVLPPNPSPGARAGASVGQSSARSLATVRLRVGNEAPSIVVAPFPIGATPPGLRIGPLHRDWTLAEWRAGSEVAPPARESVTSALLDRDAPLDAPISQGWRLYVECLAPDDSAEDAVTVWLGAFGRPDRVIRVNAEGRVTDPRRPNDAPTWTDVSRSDDRWSFRIEIPPQAVERGGVLRLGIERRDSRGLRTAAPRRMLPWQFEPGRLSVDLNAWTSF